MGGKILSLGTNSANNTQNGKSENITDLYTSSVTTDEIIKATSAQEKAKPKTDYEEWIAKQPKVGVDEDEAGWWSKTTDFLKNNWEMIVGLSAVVGGVAALTPALINQLSKIKDSIKTTPSTPTEEELEKIKQNPKSVSMKMYSFIRDSEEFTPFVKQNQYVVNLGFGNIVESNSSYNTLYPYRDNSKLVEEYMNQLENNTLDEWIKTVSPAVAPIQLIYDLYNKDIQKIESIINRELTDVVLEQYEFDALASFLWTMRGEGKIYPEFQPEALIKEIHTLLYYNDRVSVSTYMKEVDKRLIQNATVWNRREAEASLFLTGIYEVLNKLSLMNSDYDDVFSEMKNQYLANKTNDDTLNNYSSYIGNDSFDSSKKASDDKNIKRRIQSDNLPPLVSPNEILGENIINGMIYPLVRLNPNNRGGKDNTGVNNDNTICYGWFGSERGSGQTLHYGVDLVADKNNPVVMPFSGVIEDISAATKADTNLKKIVIRPDYNTNIVVSLYYLDKIVIEKGNHYDANTFIGYMGDCKSLFDGYSDTVSYTFMHFQINELSEDGTPINPISCILNSKPANIPDNILWLKEHPLLYDYESGNKTINIEDPGLYEIVLVGSGGTDIGYDLNWVEDLPVSEDNITPFKYSIPGGRGSFIRARIQLESGTYNYTVGDDTPISSSFNNNLICESGLKARSTNDKNDYNASTMYNASSDYNIIESSNGSDVPSISNIGGYNIETGEPIPYTIIQGLGNIYNNEADKFKPNTWYAKGECCLNGDNIYYSAKEKFLSGDSFDINDWNTAYSGFGNGGQVGLNGNAHLPPTPGLIYIQYINWS